MALIPLRKPRPFAGKRGQSIKDLYSGAMGGLGFVSIKPIEAENKRYNTQAVLLMEEGTLSKLAQTRTIVYKRLDLLDVFQQVSAEFKDNFIIETEKELVHPLSDTDVLKILNGQFLCDFEAEDLDIINSCCTEYTLVAKKDSPGYIGEIVVCIGRELVFDCSGAPHVTDEFEMSGSFRVELSNGQIFEGTIEEIVEQMNQVDTNGVRVLIHEEPR